MSLVLRTTAIKVVNKGGGVQRGRKDSGSDYVTFCCPRPTCQKRNKMSMYHAENYVPANEDRIPFKCKHCRTVIEVTRPIPKTTLIMSPDDFAKEMSTRRSQLAASR